jgi:hypothetical protein
MKKIIFLLIILLNFSSHALFELGGQYGLDKQVYGQNRQNNISSTTYSGSLALYLFNYTAIEVNYGKTTTVTDEKTVSFAGSETFEIASKVGTVEIESYGIGIRQAFAHHKARFVPTLSLGYAKRFAKDFSNGTFRQTSTGDDFRFASSVSKVRFDSVFATLGLNIKMTRTISLRASAQTIFKAFDFNRAQDNVKYLLGFSWYL